MTQTLPSPAGPAQHAEALRSLRGVGLALAERVGRGDHTGEVCHWADGYHLNVRLYAKLLGSVFDVLDEGQLVEASISHPSWFDAVRSRRVAFGWHHFVFFTCLSSLDWTVS